LAFRIVLQNFVFTFQSSAGTVIEQYCPVENKNVKKTNETNSRRAYSEATRVRG
jgi:hypothetical protein